MPTTPDQEATWPTSPPSPQAAQLPQGPRRAHRPDVHLARQTRAHASREITRLKTARPSSPRRARDRAVRRPRSAIEAAQDAVGDPRVRGRRLRIDRDLEPAVMTTPTVTETRRNGDRVGERVELGPLHASPPASGSCTASASTASSASPTSRPTAAAARTSSSASSSKTATARSMRWSPTTSSRPSSTAPSRCTFPSGATLHTSRTKR